MEPRQGNITLAASGDKVEIDTRGLTSLAIQVVGAMSATLQFEGTIDGKNWFSLNAVPNVPAASVSSTTAAGVWFANVTGLLSARVRCSAYTSGTPTIALLAVFSGSPLTAGPVAITTSDSKGIGVKVTPDAGTNYYPMFGNSSGIPSVNATLQASTNLIGYSMDYVQSVARGIAPGAIRKVLKASATTNSTIASWTDQGGATYTAVPTGKTLYIQAVIISAIGVSSSTGNYATVAIGDGSNQPLIAAVNSFGPVIIPCFGLLQVASTLTLSAVLTLIGSAHAVYVTVIGWEE